MKKKMANVKPLKEQVQTSSLIFTNINYVVRPGREKLSIHGPVSKSNSPSLYSRQGDERTQKFINASFLPFFALLSIPPSFN